MARPPVAEAIVVTPELLARMSGKSVEAVRKEIDTPTGFYAAANYEAIQALTNLPRNRIYKASGASVKDRQKLDITDLESVIIWLAAHGKPELRRAICGYAAQALIDDGIMPARIGASTRRTKPAAKSADRRHS